MSDFTSRSTLPFLHDIELWLKGTNNAAGFVIPGWGILAVCCMCVLIFYLFAPEQSSRNFELAFFLAPLWLPLLLSYWATHQFILWRRLFWHGTQQYVLLEIKVPRTIHKSPSAMDAFFSTIHMGPGETTWMKRLLLGRARYWTSFEIASFGGDVHLFMRTRVGYRRLLENALYAQYPEVEIIEATDYSRLKDLFRTRYTVNVFEYAFDKPNPYPLRSYIDHGLERPQLRPEMQVDPFAALLELFGSLKSGEELWLQFIVRTTKRERYRGVMKKSGKPYTYSDEINAEIEKIKKSIVVTNSVSLPTPGQTELLAAIERNAGKLQFDVGIRSVYLATPEKYHNLMGAFTAMMFKPFAAAGYNSLQTAPVFSDKFNDYPWEDIGGFRQQHEMRKGVYFYRRREYFYPPYRGTWMTMSSEELATLFHIPNTMIKTPALSRLETTTAAAPANLPT